MASTDRILAHAGARDPRSIGHFATRFARAIVCGLSWRRTPLHARSIYDFSSIDTRGQQQSKSCMVEAFGRCASVPNILQISQLKLQFKAGLLFIGSNDTPRHYSWYGFHGRLSICCYDCLVHAFVVARGGDAANILPR